MQTQVLLRIQVSFLTDVFIELLFAVALKYRNENKYL